jgi:hypothetical protein
MALFYAKHIFCDNLIFLVLEFIIIITFIFMNVLVLESYGDYKFGSH